MVTQFGMSELGPLSFAEEEEHVFLGREITRTHNQSDETLRKIDAQIQGISRECYERAQALLAEHKSKLEKLAKALVRFETLSAEEVDIVLADGDVEAYRAAQRPIPPKATGQKPASKELPGLDRGPATELA
jgi:cell division protease FtsH